MSKTLKKNDVGIRKRYISVRDSIFNRKIHVLLNYSHKDYIKWCRKQKFTNEDDGRNMDTDFAGFSTQVSGDKPSEWIICMKTFDWRINDQGTLIHEIVHTIVKIFSCNNIPFNLDTQEFLAHSIGNLYEDIAAKIFRVKKIIKKKLT